MGGWVRLPGRFREGTTVRIQYGEKLADGRISVGEPGGADNPSILGRLQLDEYTASGRGRESWQPSWGYKSFRYVEITGTDAPLELMALPVQTDLDDTLELELDHPMLQWIADAGRQTILNSMHGHPDLSGNAKLGWTGAAYHSCGPAFYQFGAPTLYAKWLDDLRLAMHDDGSLPIMSPIGVPLALGIVPDDHLRSVVDSLADDIEHQDRHLNTGSVGIEALPDALSDHGHADLAVAVLGQRTYPSYGFWKDHGATTMWESWERQARGHNDPTLTSPLRWLVERAMGVRPTAPGGSGSPSLRR